MMNELKEFFNTVANSFINFINLINSISFTSPISQSSHYKYNL